MLKFSIRLQGHASEISFFYDCHNPILLIFLSQKTVNIEAVSDSDYFHDCFLNLTLRWLYPVFLHFCPEKVCIEQCAQGYQGFVLRTEIED